MIKNIAIHHSGGIGNNLTSSAFLTWQHINQAHKTRWNFPSQYIKDSYGGYNVVYDPKDRSFHQFRAVGEETAAQKGSNFDTFSLCIIGNFNQTPPGSPLRSVDPLSQQTIDDVVDFLVNLLYNRHNLVVVDKLNLSAVRIYPHRFFQSTDCYGTFLDDMKFRKLVINKICWKIQKQITLIMAVIADLKAKRKLGKLGKLDFADRGCEAL